MKAVDLFSSLLVEPVAGEAASKDAPAAPGAFDAVLAEAVDQDAAKQDAAKQDAAKQGAAKQDGQAGDGALKAPLLRAEAEPQVAREQAIVVPRGAFSIHGSISRGLRDKQTAPLRDEAAPGPLLPGVTAGASDVVVVDGEQSEAEAALVAEVEASPSEQEGRDDSAALQNVLGHVAAAIARIVAPAPGEPARLEPAQDAVTQGPSVVMRAESPRMHAHAQSSIGARTEPGEAPAPSGPGETFVLPDASVADAPHPGAVSTTGEARGLDRDARELAMPQTGASMPARAVQGAQQPLDTTVQTGLQTPVQTTEQTAAQRLAQDQGRGAVSDQSGASRGQDIEARSGAPYTGGRAAYAAQGPQVATKAPQLSGMHTNKVVQPPVKDVAGQPESVTARGGLAEAMQTVEAGESASHGAGPLRVRVTGPAPSDAQGTRAVPTIGVPATSAAQANEGPASSLGADTRSAEPSTPTLVAPRTKPEQGATLPPAMQPPSTVPQSPAAASADTAQVASRQPYGHSVQTYGQSGQTYTHGRQAYAIAGQGMPGRSYANAGQGGARGNDGPVRPALAQMSGRIASPQAESAATAEPTSPAGSVSVTFEVSAAESQAGASNARVAAGPAPSDGQSRFVAVGVASAQAATSARVQGAVPTLDPHNPVQSTAASAVTPSGPRVGAPMPAGAAGVAPVARQVASAQRAPVQANVSAVTTDSTALGAEPVVSARAAAATTANAGPSAGRRGAGASPMAQSAEPSEGLQTSEPDARSIAARPTSASDASANLTPSLQPRSALQVPAAELVQPTPEAPADLPLEQAAAIAASPAREEQTSGDKPRGAKGTADPMARVEGFTRGARFGVALSAYAGRGHDNAEHDTRGQRSEEREREVSSEKSVVDPFTQVIDQSVALQPTPTVREALPLDLAPRVPAVPVATPAPELPDVEFSRTQVTQPQNASISLHHPDLGPIQIQVHRLQDKVEVSAVIESAHAEAVLRANESGIRIGVQQSGMTFGSLRVKVRGQDRERDKEQGRPAQVRRRRAIERGI